MTEPGQLRRDLRLFGATMMGLGAMIGTGVFVSIGIAAGIAGPAVVLAIALAAAVAICNGLSSAQLAASHPVSGGTYEYGYRYLNSWAGFTAGWMFLIAKSASAATAALGFAGYLLFTRETDPLTRILVALAALVILTAVILGGMRRSHLANTAIVSVTLASLLLFVVAGLPVVSRIHFEPFLVPLEGEAPLRALFHATALMFVAYTGYGRIATLGEEVHEPRRTIPRAIILTMIVTMVLYLSVAIVGVGAAGAGRLAAVTGAEAAPLALVAQQFPLPFTSAILSVGAITAMLGVLLNLILGLSRVLLAMGRREDAPAVFARVGKHIPVPAVIGVSVIIALLILTGDVRTTWSFSAFTVLIYYALTNLAALRLPSESRLYPPFIAWTGLIACLALAFQVDRTTWLAGLGLILVGLLWHAAARRMRQTA
jgi:basic amino acid/polyamine antiporter, APA family